MLLHFCCVNQQHSYSFVRAKHSRAGETEQDLLV